MVRVVIINDFAYVDGGASQIALGSAKALARRGHRVSLFTGVGAIDPALSATDGLDVTCLDLHEIARDPNRARAMTSGLWNEKAARAFDRYLQGCDNAGTVIHVHTWTKALSSSVIRRALDLGFPVLLTLHDYFSVCPTGSFFNHSTQQICHLQPMSAACVSTNCDSRNYGHKLWRVGRHFIQNNAGGLPGGIRNFISISALSERIIAPLLPGGVRMNRVRNFIDIEKETPVEAGANIIFSFAGRLSAEKGPELLAQCASKLTLPIQFIGDGPLKEKLAAQLPDAIFTGWVTPSEVRKRLRLSRALVLPSLWYETQGLVVSEAAAMGVAAIVPSTSAACEWVEDGVTGLVFEGGNADDLGRKITLLRNAPEEAQRMGANAYERYWQNPMTATLHCEQLEAVYEVMIADAFERRGARKTVTL